MTPTSPSRLDSAGARATRLAGRVLLILAIIAATLGTFDVYRAWFPVRSLSLQVISPRVSAGIPVMVQVTSAGLSPVDVRLELVQGSHTEMLATLRVAASRDAYTNPRPRLGNMTPAFTAEFLGHFQPGAATIRATAVGPRKWLYTPSPVVQETPVAITAP